MPNYEAKINHLKENKERKQILKQNVDDIKNFYKFLGHKTKTDFQVFEAMTHIKTSIKPSKASKQSFISCNDIKTLLQLCNQYKLKGVLCLGINERPNEQTKLTEILPKINVILFDIDVRKEKKIDGISPDNLKKEAYSVVLKCKQKLEILGFIVDMIVDSGNGYHVYIKVNLYIPNYTTKEEFEETPIYEQLVYLEALLRDFNTENVVIDFLSKDIMRRVKIPGTYNIKRYKDIDSKFKLMPKEQWRLAKILYLNKAINEEKNNKVFFNLPLNYEIVTKKKENIDVIKTKESPNAFDRFIQLLEKDEKLKKLYNNKLINEFKSRSEAEISLITKLFQYEFNELEINLIMETCLIGKWQESPDAYKKTTMRKAFDFVKKHPKSIFSKEQKKMHLLYYEETKQFATYKRDGKEAENNTFKKWYDKRKLEELGEEYFKKKEENHEISAVVKESETTVHKVVCNEKKLIYRKTKTVYNRKTHKLEAKNFDSIIINEPFYLENIYYNQNLELFYEVKFGNEIVCFNKRDLLGFIENERNYGFIVGKQLKECVSVILREFEKVNHLEPKEMYFTMGIFTDKNDNLIVVHPDNEDIKVYGINAYQKRTIERVKKKGLDIDGVLLNEYFQLFHYKTYPEEVRLTTFGHSLIANFFNVLRDDIDIFPSHFYITPVRSVGKTVLFKLIYADLFGIELKSGDDIDSTARFSENCTDTTTCMPIDDIDKIDPKVLNQMKTAGTTLKAKERMTKDQKIIIQETYRAFSGTANSDEFISGDQNEALRGRCIISRDFIIVNNFRELKKLDEIEEKVRSNSIIGYHLLTKAIEYINKMIDIDNISSHVKLIRLIKQNKEALRKYFESKTIFDDPRRLTIYALLYTSWQIWNYIFQDSGLHSDLLKEILDYKENSKLLQYIRKYEENMLQMNIDDILNILEFYEEIKDNNGKIRYQNKENLRILDTLFVNEYDKWAKIHGYEPLRKLTKLGEMLSKILKKNMKPKNNKSRHIGKSPNTPYNKTKYGIPFKAAEIYVRMGMKEYNKEIYNRIIEIFDACNKDKLELNNITQTLALDYQEKDIKKNINLMIIHRKFTKSFDGETLILEKK